MGGGDLFARKKLRNARKRELYTRTQIAVKTKTFPILTSNETIIIPKTQRNSDFWNPHGKRKLLITIVEFVKSGRVQLQHLTEERKTTFGSSYREDRKNQDSTVCYFETRHTPSHDFNRQPV